MKAVVTALRLLLIEDADDDATLLLHTLAEAGIAIEPHRIATELELRAALRKGGWQAVISDFALPGFDGLKALEMVRARDPNVPFLFVSGAVNDAFGARVMQAGANDYLPKNNLARLAPALLRELNEAQARRDGRIAATLYENVVATASDAIVTIDTASRILLFNQAAEKIFGFAAAEVLGQPIEKLLPSRLAPHHHELVQAFADSALPSKVIKGAPRAVTGRRADGSEFPVEINISRASLEGHTTFTAILRDLTEQHEAKKALDLYADVFRSSGEGIVITDANNRIIAVNAAFTRITGYTLQDIAGRCLSTLAEGETPRKVYDAMWHELHNTGLWQGELAQRHKGGESFPAWMSISASRDAAGNVVNYIVSLSDMSEVKAAQRRVHFLAHHDVLTGLPNRFSLEERLAQALNTARRNWENLALLFIDMDRFKDVNDTFGHVVGDALLAEVAKRLNRHVRRSDIVARLGGDEFVIVLTELGNAEPVDAIARALVHGLGEPYCLSGHVVNATPSIGISVFPTHGGDVETLMCNADTAMYHAKAQGRNNYQFFSDAMHASADARQQTERELQEAIDKRQFELVYQPKVSRRGHCLAGFEALLRWRHPERGLVLPEVFVQVLEETRLIVPVGHWVLEEACRQHQEWLRRHRRRVPIAVNLSAHQLRLSGLVDQVGGLLDKYDMAGADLQLEVTESVAMENPDAAVSLLGGIRDLGVELAIDDFGTGYSSLAYLKSLPIQVLKLDGTFVRDIDGDGNNAEISAATIALAHNLGLKVVAEGVETQEQRDLLHGLRCDYLQGYYFSKPLPPAEAIRFPRRCRPLQHGETAAVDRLANGP